VNPDDSIQDPQCVPASPEGEERAAQIARIFREHNRILVGLLVSRVHDIQDAKEIAQEAYVKVLQLEPKNGAIGYLRSYLFRTAENLAVDRLRQRRSRNRIDQLESTELLFVEGREMQTALAKQELALLKCAVTELPGRCREAFRLHKIEDRPLDDVAKMMDVSERMVRKFIGRALVYLRLRREGYSAEEAKKRITS
jgi:RNA polymerase sigma-70 factor (ECF subfamily)